MQIANYTLYLTHYLQESFFDFYLCYHKNAKARCMSLRSRVKWFKDEKGYGFIKYTDNEDIFVHYSSIIQNGYKTLKKDDEVEFELIETPKGYQAINTKKIDQ